MEQINEALAREAKRANSWNDYVEGSATEGYNAHCTRVREAAEERKKDIPEEYWENLDALVERYCTKLANWINRHNACRASCPSIMIAGGSNFPVSKKERQIAREDALMKEYINVIEPLIDKIKSFGSGEFKINAKDPDAIDKLRAKIAELEANQTEMKQANAYYRKNKSMKGYQTLTDQESEELDKEIENSLSWCRQPCPSYMLSNNNQNIRATKQRLESLERMKQNAAKTYDTSNLGFEVEENKEIMRLQLKFDGKPSEEIRALLKSKGFRWAPSQSAWQRQLTTSARYAVEDIIKKIKNKGD